jgi:hypothetical protein
MYIVPRYLLVAGLSVAVAASFAGCKNNNPPANTDATNTQAQNYSQDPADANIAPISNASTENSTPQSGPGGYPEQSSQQYASSEYPPDQYGNYDNYNNYDQPVEYADQAPPPLPEYDQPPCPGEGYIWTPGYWNWGSGGYYWVPGAWVQAPYQGALWTPGYWSYESGRYGWHRGFWGRHVGYYGGIDYGHGYTGYGYHGGYWDHDRFDYDRDVNNVNPDRVRYVYNYPVQNEHRGGDRVSFDGPRGIQVKPRPAEVAALHEQHTPPMTAQTQIVQQARSDRGNFAAVNHGRPQMVAEARPLPADHVAPPPAAPMRQPVPSTNATRTGQPARNYQPAAQPRANEPARRETPGVTPHAAPRQQEPVPQQHPAPVAHPERRQPAPEHQAPAQHAQTAPERQSPTAQHPLQQQHPPPVARPERPQPSPQHQPPQRMEQQRPAPVARPENQHQRAAPEARQEQHKTEPKKPEDQNKRPQWGVRVLAPAPRAERRISDSFPRLAPGATV